jgi:hypothetical protein
LVVVINVREATIRLKRCHQPILLTIVHHDDDRATVQTLPVPRTTDEGHSPTVLAEVGEEAAPVAFDDVDEAAEEFVKGRARRPLFLTDGMLEVLGEADVDRVTRSYGRSSDALTTYLALCWNFNSSPERLRDDVLSNWPKRSRLRPYARGDEPRNDRHNIVG